MNYTANDLKDPSAFKNILNYLMYDEKISSILVIQKGKIDEVGDFILSLDENIPMDEDQNKIFLKWIEDETIKVYSETDKEYQNRETEFVYCIRLLPFYLVEFQGKEFV